MKNFKKVVAGLLALLMLALSVNVTFAAEEYTEKEAVVVAKVNAAGIMQGTDKGFEPSKTLTRAEAAAIMVRMKGISEDTVKQNAGATLFTDVAASHWAAGYVNVASNYGIIKGVGANKFAPEKEVTVAEFYTMAIRALNAGDLVESEGTWPTNYVNFAIENDLAEDVAQLYTAAATRMTAATIVANTLEAKMWKKAAYVNNGEITFTQGNDTILDDVLKIYELTEATITVTNSKKNKGTVSGTKADASNPNCPTDFAEKANLTTAKSGLKYTVWYNKDEVLGFWLPEDNTMVKFSEIKAFATNGDIKLVVDGTEEKFKGKDAKIYLNEGAESTSWSAGTLPTFGVAYYGTGDDSDKIVKVYAEEYTAWGVVKEVKNNTIKFKDIEGDNAGNININEDKDSNYVYRVTKNGQEISINDIEEDDVLFIHTNGTNSHDYTINVFADTVEGKVTAKAGTTKVTVTIDGTKYELATSMTINAGDEGTLYLAENGKAVMFEADKKSTDACMISAARSTTDSVVGSSVKVEIKYTTMDGELSDWTEVDLEKSTAYVENVDQATISTGKLYNTHATYTAKEPNYDMIGKVVAYEIKSGKIVLKADGAGKDQEIANLTAFTDGESIDKITLTTLGTYFLSDDAIAYEIESNKKTGAKKELTLKSVNVDDLDNLTGLNGYAVDLDIDQKVARVLILDKTNIKSTKQWAVVLEVASYDDGDSDTDEDIQVTALFAGEKEATTYLAKAADVKVSTHDLAAGDVAEFSITDGVIKSVKELFADTELIANDKLDAVTVTTNKYFTKEYNNGAKGIGAYTSAAWTDATTHNAAEKSVIDTTYVFANDVVVVKVKDGEYKVSSADDLKFLDIKFGGDPTSAPEASDFNKDNLDGVSEITKMLTWTEDGETEVIAILYK